MASLCQEVLRRVLLHVVIFQGATTNCLDVKWLQGTLKKLSGNSMVSAQLFWQIKNSFRAQIKQRPVFHVLEQLFFEFLSVFVPVGNFKRILDKL